MSAQNGPERGAWLAAAAALAARLTVSGSPPNPGTPGHPPTESLPRLPPRPLHPANDDDPEWIARWRILRRTA